MITDRVIIMKEISNNLKGTFFILLAMLFLAFQDIFIKIISINTNLFLIFFLRSVIGVTIILFFLKFKKLPIVLKTHYPLLTLIRCLLSLIAFGCIFISLSILSYPIVVTIFFASPLIMTILSKIILQKNIGFRRWVALSVGFVGVYIVMNPEFNNLNLYTLFPLLTALSYATLIIIQHKTADKDNLFAQTFHLFFAAILLSLIAGIFFGNGKFDIYENEALQFMFRRWEISFNSSLVLLIAIGFAFSIGILLLFHAYRIASPPNIAPFEYILIIYALLLSWIIWGDTIDLRSLIGLVLIIGGGFYTFVNEIKSK